MAIEYCTNYTHYLSNMYIYMPMAIEYCTNYTHYLGNMHIYMALWQLNTVQTILIT